MPSLQRLKSFPKAFLGFENPNFPLTFGNVFFVDSGDANAQDDTAHGSAPETPFATIDYAVGRCTANNGDVIVALPGHTDTITAAGGLDFDVAGVTVIGIGSGTSRPTINFTTATTADIDVAAANVTLQNLYFDLTGIDALVSAIDVDAAYFTMRNCHILQADSGGQAVRSIITDANADYMTIEGCYFEGSSDAGSTEQIRLVGCAHPVIRNNVFVGNCSAGNIVVATTAATDILIEHNDLNNFHAVDVNIEGLAATTGTIRYNTCRIATDAQTTWINTPGATQLFENYGVNNDGERGIAIGTASV